MKRTVYMWEATLDYCLIVACQSPHTVFVLFFFFGGGGFDLKEGQFSLKICIYMSDLMVLKSLLNQYDALYAILRWTYVGKM